jgi:hypothetical protein
MWNLITYKAQSEKFKDHQKHIERIFEVKTRIKNNEPKKPIFLFAGKRNLESGRIYINLIIIDKIIKINYENNWIMKKIIGHELNHRPYHPSKIKHFECPPFYQKTYSQIRNSNEKKIKNENQVNIKYNFQLEIE